MKMEKNRKLSALLIATFLAAAIASANALTDAQILSVKNAFDKVPKVELAPKAAQIVAQTPAEERVEMAVLVVTEIAKKNPAGIVTVVSAVSTAAPETAPAISALAVKLVKQYTQAITLAAINAAPDQANRIVQAIAESNPSSVATLAKLVVPESTSTTDSGLDVPRRAPEMSKRAITASSTGGIKIEYGSITGVIYPAPPNTPLGGPNTGYDPNRYPQP